MSYKVLNTFKEKEHEDAVYNVDEIYPKDGHTANPKRVSFLQGSHPEYGVRFLDSTEDKPDKETPVKVPEEPKKAEKKVTTVKKSDAK